MGVKNTIIVCNTSHAYNIFSVIESSLKERGCSINLINIVSETVEYIVNINVNSKIKVGVLSTLASNKVGLYENKLIQNGIETICLPPDKLENVQNVIDDIKAHSSCSKSSEISLKNIFEYFLENKVTHIVLGCTELPICISDNYFKNIEIVDPMVIAARKIISLY